MRTGWTRRPGSSTARRRITALRPSRTWPETPGTTLRSTPPSAGWRRTPPTTTGSSCGTAPAWPTARTARSPRSDRRPRRPGGHRRHRQLCEPHRQRGPVRSGHYLPRRVGPDDRIRLDVNVAQRRFGDVGRHGVGGRHWPRLPPALPLPDRRHQQRRHHLQRGPHGQQPVINGCASVPPGSVVDGAVSSDGEVVLGCSFVLGRQRVGGQGWDRVVSAGVHDVAEGERPAGVE